MGDAVRTSSPWWLHTDLETKKKWFGRYGGFDSEIGWDIYLKEKTRLVNKFFEAAKDNSDELIGEFGSHSIEQHIPLINAIANDNEQVFQLNILNNGAIENLPDNVLVEIPVIANSSGVKGVHIGKLPDKLMNHIIMPRMILMEQMLYAYLNGDKQTLILSLMNDNRTKSYEQACAVIEDLLNQPWNKELKQHYK